MAIVNKTETKEEPVKSFPKIMRSTYNGQLVLFYKNRYGVALSVVDGGEIGNHSDIWNMGVFVDHNEPVTIQNK